MGQAKYICSQLHDATKTVSQKRRLCVVHRDDEYGGGFAVDTAIRASNRTISLD
jgi:hypothetical protein